MSSSMSHSLSSQSHASFENHWGQKARKPQVGYWSVLEALKLSDGHCHVRVSLLLHVTVECFL